MALSKLENWNAKDQSKIHIVGYIPQWVGREKRATSLSDTAPTNKPG